MSPDSACSSTPESLLSRLSRSAGEGYESQGRQAFRGTGLRVHHIMARPTGIQPVPGASNIPASIELRLTDGDTDVREIAAESLAALLEA